MVFGKRYPSYIRQRRRRLGMGTLVLILVVAALAWLGYRRYIQMSLDKGHELLVAGDFEAAEQAYMKVVKLPFSGGRGHDGLGALDLLRGDDASARAHFDIVLARRPGGSPGGTAAILDAFIDQGRYGSGKIYGDFLRDWKSEKELEAHAVSFAAICLGAHDLEGARDFLDQVEGTAARSDRYRRISELLEAYEEERRMPVMLDRKGRPLLFFNTETSEYELVSPRNFAGWRGSEGIAAIMDEMDPVAAQNTLHTTIDLDLQQAATQSMQGYDGTMILAAPGTGDILAAYASEGYAPFSTLFEPGSVIKVLTYALFLEDGGNPSAHAPKRYLSSMMIGDKQFWDWTEQGYLETVEEGMAVSCNLMFARMGLDLTWPGVQRGFSRIYDGERYPGFWGEATYGEITSAPVDDYDLGNVSIGLAHIETTTLGLSILPLSVAGDGISPVPRLLTSINNVEGDVIREVATESMGRLFSAETADALALAMREAVIDDRGTARRAEVDFVDAAMKTGTSGSRPFNSVMIGMFPYENPRLTFALFLHNGGKCEYHGTKVAKRLQEAVRELAPEYLGN